MPALLLWEPGLWGIGLVDPKTLLILGHSSSSWLVPGGAGSPPGWGDRGAFTWVLNTFSQCPSGHTVHSWVPGSWEWPGFDQGGGGSCEEALELASPFHSITPAPTPGLTPHSPRQLPTPEHIPGRCSGYAGCGSPAFPPEGRPLPCTHPRPDVRDQGKTLLLESAFPIPAACCSQRWPTWESSLCRCHHHCASLEACGDGGG